MSDSVVMVVDRKAFDALVNATDETLPDAVRAFRRRAVPIERNAASPYDRRVCEAVILAAVDAVDSQYETRATHSGAIHVCVGAEHETDLARTLLPLFNASHFGRLIRQHGGEFMNAYHHAPKRAA